MDGRLSGYMTRKVGTYLDLKKGKEFDSNYNPRDMSRFSYLHFWPLRIANYAANQQEDSNGSVLATAA